MAYCSPNGQIKETLRDKNIPYLPIDKLSFSQVRRIIKEFKPDIVHAHDVKASAIASIFGEKYTVISHMHVNNNNMSKLNFKTFLYYTISYRFKHIFWVSKSCFQGYYFNDKINSKSSILYNVIDGKEIRKKAYLDNKKYDYDICYVGRLVNQKNPKRLIRILSEVIKQMPTIKCAIIGDGYLSGEIQKLISELKLENNIKMLGFQSNPHVILKDSKVMVMTSIFEGTPMCALEAMALGIPIISTPTDGMNDIVKNGITGYLSDNNEILVEKIIAIISNSKKQKEMALASYNEFIKNNNLKKYKYELEVIYNE